MHTGLTVAAVANGVYGRSVVWEGVRYFVLPEGDGPNAPTQDQDTDPHTLPAGAAVVDVGDEGWASVLENVIVAATSRVQ